MKLNVNVDRHITMLEAICHQTVKSKSQYITVQTNKTGCAVWSGSMDVDKERRTSSANF